MRKLLNILIALALLAVLLGSLVTYRVSFNETVVLTTFGRADETSVKNADGEDAGLKFKLPWPIQSVQQRYDRRVQFMATRLEETPTRGGQGIIVEVYAVWQVADPLALLQTLNTMNRAETELHNRLRNAQGIIGTYTYDELISSQADNRKLAELEQRMMQTVQAELDAGGYGIQLHNVGVRRLVLPASVTEKVFDRMRTTREGIASKTISDGSAAVSRITSAAESSATTILSFAEARAQAIRSEGDARASAYYAVQQQNPEFAVFLDRIEALPQMFGINSTIILQNDNPLIAPLLDIDATQGNAAPDQR